MVGGKTSAPWVWHMYHHALNYKYAVSGSGVVAVTAIDSDTNTGSNRGQWVTANNRTGGVSTWMTESTARHQLRRTGTGTWHLTDVRHATRRLPHTTNDTGGAISTGLTTAALNTDRCRRTTEASTAMTPSRDGVARKSYAGMSWPLSDPPMHADSVPGPTEKQPSPTTTSHVLPDMRSYIQ